MGEVDEDVILAGLSPGRFGAPSRLDDVGADVRLGTQFTDFANEDGDLTKGDPVPVLD